MRHGEKCKDVEDITPTIQKFLFRKKKKQYKGGKPSFSFSYFYTFLFKTLWKGGGAITLDSSDEIQSEKTEHNVL